MASLQAALKNAIQVEYTSLKTAKSLQNLYQAVMNGIRFYFYESAEGGAGVLRRLVDDPEHLPE